MPDGFGGFMTPILAAFDPDGRKTDKLTGKDTPNADDGRPPPNADGGGRTPNADPAPGGRHEYIYEQNAFGDNTYTDYTWGGGHVEYTGDEADKAWAKRPGH